MLVQTRLLTIKEVAATLRQSERTVRGKVADGTLGLSFYPLIWGFRRCPILDTYDREFPVRGTPVVAHAYYADSSRQPRFRRAPYLVPWEERLSLPESPG